MYCVIKDEKSKTYIGAGSSANFWWAYKKENARIFKNKEEADNYIKKEQIYHMYKVVVEKI